jgi:hypothetical protein
MSVELMVGTKGLFIVVIISTPLVPVFLVALILVSGWLRRVIVLKVVFQLPLCFLLFKPSFP